MKTIRIMVFITGVLWGTSVYAQTELSDKAKAGITEMLKSEFVVYENKAKETENGSEKPSYYSLGTPTNVSVSDDRIVLTYDKKNVKIINLSSRLIKEYPRTLLLGQYMFMQGNNSRYGSRQYEETEKEHSENGKDEQFYQYMKILCYQNSDALIDEFKPIAEKYRALTIKPVVSEEQRKFIVQANAANEQKNYTRAIERYNQAIEIEPTAYPAAYSNLALLLAQTHNFNEAIINMKKYLMLVPEAEDARSAQDKIYEWEDRLIN
jgi:tetratricopeptide (TPR) repeat protein